jgi:NAD(P)-dependent dehydrogenase (short-subunit alcohol dehydrogenase family)
MDIRITQKVAGVVALLTGGLLGIGAVIAKRLAPNGADVTSVFVTNGGYNGVQQVLRLSTVRRRRRIDCDERLSQNGENH